MVRSSSKRANIRNICIACLCSPSSRTFCYLAVKPQVTFASLSSPAVMDIRRLRRRLLCALFSNKMQGYLLPSPTGRGWGWGFMFGCWRTGHGGHHPTLICIPNNESNHSRTGSPCPVLQQEARVFTPLSNEEGLGVGLSLHLGGVGGGAVKECLSGGGKIIKKHEMINACNTIVTHYKYLCKLMINLL